MRTIPCLLCALLCSVACAGPPRQLVGSVDAAGPPADAAPPVGTFYVGAQRDGKTGAGTEEDPYRSLQYAIDHAGSGSTLVILSGLHFAQPQPFTDPTCGNCADADFRADIPATVGFHVADKELTLRGESREESVLATGAGYGVLFERAGNSRIENLRITGGRRDGDGRATDAGIVVRDTHLAIHEVDVAENDDLYEGTPDPIVGIAGVAVREAAIVDIDHSRILDSSWDGIAVYRGDPQVPGSGPVLNADNNLVACTRRCVSRAGRGVGIGVTWDAKATITNNEVHHYWKGIGAFGTTQVKVTNNFVHDQHGWGVVITADAHADVVNNVILHNGTTGLAAWEAGVTGRFANNALVDNGANTDEWVGKRTGMWLNSTQVATEYNLLWHNKPVDACTGGVPGGEACTDVPGGVVGKRGNLSSEPGFADGGVKPAPGSVLIDHGDPALADPDGSRSDIGCFGGPAASWDPPPAP